MNNNRRTVVVVIVLLLFIFLIFVAYLIALVGFSTFVLHRKSFVIIVQRIFRILFFIHFYSLTPENLTPHAERREEESRVERKKSTTK